MLRNVDIWIGSYLRHRLSSLRPAGRAKRRHVLFCVVDHFEPLWGGADEATADERLSRWIEGYEGAARRFADAGGRTPRHSYFYPLDEYRGRHLGVLGEHCARGFGEVEIHLHHHDDTAEHLAETLEEGKRLFAASGLLGVDGRGEVRFGFVHGNWALDNSNPDGSWCGVNSEITVLHRSGCYADFTLPSAPSRTQTRTINAVYYAVDDPDKPKSHDRGIPVEVGGAPPLGSPHLLIVQGPLMLDWRWRLHGIFPRIENGEISPGHPPMAHRWKLWIGAAVSVHGRPEWLLVKVHLHGCEDATFRMLFREEAFERLQRDFLSLQRSHEGLSCHYVTAREAYNIIRAAEAGETGDPLEFKDYLIAPPPCAR